MYLYRFCVSNEEGSVANNTAMMFTPTFSSAVAIVKFQSEVE